MSNEAIESFVVEEFPKLDFLTKAILNVHGKGHPELSDVRTLFLQMKEKAKEKKYSFKEEMIQLNTVTKAFTLPSDACEAYTGAYELLQELEAIVTRKDK